MTASPAVLTEKITPDWIRAAKARGEKLPALTCYDYPLARLLDEAGIPILLVGDSLGMVVLGYPDTTHVSIDQMYHHVAAVARAKPRGLVVADLPYQTYTTVEKALKNAQVLINAGADAVKLEGGMAVEPQVRALVQAGLPVMGHLGMLPQSIREEGGYKIKGKTEEQRLVLLREAQGLEAAGAFALVLELVQAEATREITAALKIPTIGIGSGLACDGQILVTHDLVGAFPWFKPKFVQPKANIAEEISRAVQAYATEVRR